MLFSIMLETGMHVLRQNEGGGMVMWAVHSLAGRPLVELLSYPELVTRYRRPLVCFATRYVWNMTEDFERTQVDTRRENCGRIFQLRSMADRRSRLANSGLKGANGGRKQYWTTRSKEKDGGASRGWLEMCQVR